MCHDNEFKVTMDKNALSAAVDPGSVRTICSRCKQRAAAMAGTIPSLLEGGGWFRWFAFGICLVLVIGETSLTLVCYFIYAFVWLLVCLLTPIFCDLFTHPFIYLSLVHLVVYLFLHFRRPFVTWFVLCHQTVVCPVCICLSVSFIFILHCVRWAPSSPQRGTAPTNFRPRSFVAKRLVGSVICTWYGGRPRQKRHSIRWGPSPLKGAQQPHSFWSICLWSERSFTRWTSLESTKCPQGICIVLRITVNVCWSLREWLHQKSYLFSVLPFYIKVCFSARIRVQLYMLNFRVVNCVFNSGFRLNTIQSDEFWRTHRTEITITYKLVHFQFQLSRR